MARISSRFPLSHGVPRVDDRRVVSGIVYVIRNGLQWNDAPTGYEPHKTLYNASFDGAGSAYSTASSIQKISIIVIWLAILSPE